MRDVLPLFAIMSVVNAPSLSSRRFIHDTRSRGIGSAKYVEQITLNKEFLKHLIIFHVKPRRSAIYIRCKYRD